MTSGSVSHAATFFGSACRVSRRTAYRHEKHEAPDQAEAKNSHHAEVRPRNGDDMRDAGGHKPVPELIRKASFFAENHCLKNCRTVSGGRSEERLPDALTPILDGPEDTPAAA
jgi:hypothetical protein